ncbi:MAG TPA: hypothetical protein VK617_16795 [Gemmatimonadaceae bacterium]|nr:hypothetical protein [Gemmatimonadaceae bacterium]
MRSIGLPLVLVSMVAAIACTSDRALAPTSGHSGQLSDIPPELIADYSKVTLPGSETVVALNDSGDVVGSSASGGVLWHGAAHERTTLPIIPTAIANDGTVAGSIDGHAATWRNGRVTILDTAASVALAICRCESATVVGSVRVNGVTHAAIWVDGIRIDAGVPPNGDSAVFSAIGTGFVVGNANVRVFDGRTNSFVNLPEPYSWSHAGGWQSFSFGNGATSAVIVSLNSHGVGVGFGVGPNNFGDVRAIVYFVAFGSADDSPSSHEFFDGVESTGINDSQLISANTSLSTENGPGRSVALVGGHLLPPGVIGDRTAGINSAGIVAGNSDGSPVLWTPNP